MKTFVIESTGKIKKAIPKIEEKIKIRLSVKKNVVSLRGNELNEFVVEEIIRAVDFGFDVEDALLLKGEDFCLEFIDVKEHTNRKNLKEVRGRLIGTKGKAKKTIQKLTGAVIVIRDNQIGIIVDSEHLEAVCQAVVSLIQGAKHANAFAYLEKQNVKLRKADKEDLGLKNL